MIDAIKQRLERRSIVRSKQPLVIVDTCEDEMRYVDRLDLDAARRGLSRVFVPAVFARISVSSCSTNFRASAGDRSK